MEKYILSEMRDKNFSKAVNEIYLLTDYNKLQYPNYYKWYYGKNLPRILNGTGEAIFRWFPNSRTSNAKKRQSRK